MSETPVLDPLDPALPWHQVDRFLGRCGVRVGNFPAVLHPPHTDPFMQTTGGKHASNSVHPRGRGRDLSQGQGADVAAALLVLLPLANGNAGKVWIHQLFYTPTDTFLQDGHRVPEDVIERQNLRGIHADHLHVGLFEFVSLDDCPVVEGRP